MDYSYPALKAKESSQINNSHQNYPILNFTTFTFRVTPPARMSVPSHNGDTPAPVGKMNGGCDPTHTRANDIHRSCFHDFPSGWAMTGWESLPVPRTLIREARVIQPMCKPVPRPFLSLYSDRRR